MKDIIQEVKSGNARSLKVSSVEVGIDKEMIDIVADVTTTVIMQKYGPTIGVTRDEIVRFNAVSLTAAMMKAIDGNAVIPREIQIPCYYDSMIKGLNTQMGRSVIDPTLARVEITVPTGYRKVALTMKALGLNLVNPHRPAIDNSATLSLFKETIDDVVVIIGNSSSISVDDLVRRGLLQVEANSEALLRGIAGELALQYGELDNLLVDYFSSACRVTL